MNYKSSGIWDLSRGFLPANDPITNLPLAFTALDQFGAELPKLLAAEAVGKQIKNLSPLDPAGLNDEQAERAMMLYSFIAHAYVFELWKKNIARKIIPCNIAIPWVALAKRLGRPPILSYASYALYNWKRIDTADTVKMGNIVLLQNFLGGLDEECFILPHVAIEAVAEKVVREIIRIRNVLSGNKDKYSLENCLAYLRFSLCILNDVLARIPESCDPYIYYNRVRPYIFGWEKNPALPEGMIYEGVDEFKGKPQKFRGETGAQSSIIPLVDAILGVTHSDVMPDGSRDILKSYLMEMRNYMPMPHRDAIADIELKGEGIILRNLLAAEKTRFRHLVQRYNAVLETLAKFREMHLEYAARYIHMQAQKSGANPRETGTGGTPFMIYLSKHLAETKAAMIS